MKKKAVALCATVALAAVALGGATLAYFTDTDSQTNTFTTSNVKIDLIEKQRNDAGTALEDFKDGKVLMPIVGSAQGEKETVGGVAGLPTAENYVDKIMTIKNEASDAYVRLYVAIPTVLDNVGDAGQNILHFNTTAESSVAGEWGNEALVAGNFAIDDISYNIYYRTYATALAKDKATKTPAYVGFYMDKNVDYNGSSYTITRDGKTSVINFDFSAGVKIPVYAVGVQAAGFEDQSADAAITAAFGADFNPWADAQAGDDE